jgi:hypothetical protein
MSGRALSALLSLVLLLAATVAVAQDRSLLVRGRVVDPAGLPLVGARVTARGTVTSSTVTDERGRYALTLALGRPAALARAPFTLEVRAEHRGRRLPFAIQGSAFALEMTLAAGEPPLARVRSNSPSAALAVAAALLTPAAPQAMVEADFGGAALGGTVELMASEEVPVPEAAGLRPVGARVPDAVTPRPARPVAATARVADSVRAARRDSSRREQAARSAAARAERDRRAQRDSVARAAARLQDHARQERTAPPPRATASPPRPRDPARPAPGATVSVRDSLAAPVTGAASRVRRVEPYAAGAAGPAPVAANAVADSCVCRVRGTIEVQWERPLEQDLQVLVVLDGPVRTGTQVELFIGSPREFEFGPLPCGRYALGVEPLGRHRYRVVRGDGALDCRGSLQQRVVLTPARR